MVRTEITADAMMESLDKDQSLENLAHIHKVAMELGDDGNRESARKLLERVLDIMQSLYPQHGYSVSVVAYNLALQLHHQKNYDASRILYERVIAMREHILGPDSPELWTSLCAVGNLDIAQRRSDYDRLATRKILECALLLSEKAAAQEDARLANCLIALATTYQPFLFGDDQGEQVRLLKRALGVYEKEYGGNSVEVARLLVSLATASIPGDPRVIGSYIQRAVDIFEAKSEMESAKTTLREVYLELRLDGNIAAEDMRRRLDAFDRTILGED